MRFRELLDPDRVLAASMKLAICLIVVSVFLQFVICLVKHISPAAEFVMLCIFFLLSPVAYLIRRWRLGGTQRSGARRGAERTPLLPQNEDVV
jgi:hypothetical protein